ncbi:MAG: thiamine pyrophosphate-requiring protein, partial [Cyanobacteria bacterium REEB65]|nr:thiamine pyrophosphate-requiring protein [Cyanobacteria bacterium REEB65]
LFKDVANEFVHCCTTPQQARHLVDRAVRIARSKRTVTCIIFPKDVQELEYEGPARVHGSIHSGLGYSDPKVVPTAADLAHAADVLNAGKKVAILVGAGAKGAAPEVLAVADALGAGIAKALLGKDVVPDDLPFVTGAIGLLGTRPSWNMLMNCDTLLMVGSGFPYSEFLPQEGQARGVQIDRESRMLSIRYPMEVNLVGDAQETLRALLPLLPRKEERSWRQQIERDVAEWWRVLEARSKVESTELNPQLPYWQLSSRLPDGCILAADSGSSANWFARQLKIREGMLASLSGNLATMGSAIPYALAAKFAHPHRPVIAMTGDGVMQMNGLNGLIDIAKYWRRWANPQLIVLVLNNRDLNQVTWEQRVMAGDPKFEASQDVPDFPYARFAEMIGLTGIKMTTPQDVVPGWDTALSADRPCLVEAYTDPEVPPLPPHITLEQARGYASSIFKGDPNALANIRLTFLEMVQAWSPVKK